MKEASKVKPFSKEQSFEKGFFYSKTTYIHPTAIIGTNVSLGNNVKVGPYSIIVGNVHIDDNSKIYSHVTIGMPAQDTNTQLPLGTISIGKNCNIRECVTIGSSKEKSGKTVIGDNCYIMNYSHIAHDVILEHNVILINNVNLAGHVYVEHDSMIMANSAAHQHCKIGAYSALAPFSGIRQDIPPFCLFDGTPAGFAGLNTIGLKRAGLTPEQRLGIKRIAAQFFREKYSVEQLENNLSDDPILTNNQYVKKFISFIKNSDRGITRRLTRYSQERSQV